MSRKQFASELSITVGAVSNYENLSRTPRLAIAYRIIALAKQQGCIARLEDIYVFNHRQE